MIGDLTAAGNAGTRRTVCPNSDLFVTNLAIWHSKACSLKRRGEILGDTQYSEIEYSEKEKARHKQVGQGGYGCCGNYRTTTTKTVDHWGIMQSSKVKRPFLIISNASFSIIRARSRI
jgi:hypothetical protein